VKGITMDQPRTRWFSHVQVDIKRGQGWQGIENKKDYDDWRHFVYQPV
jgi:hypothetical protein